MKFNREDLVNQLRERAQESYKSKDEGGKYGKYYRSPPLPEWKCSEGEHVIDILPFFAGENYPTKSHASQGKPVDPGKILYWLDVWIHSKIGVNEDNVVCPSMSYGKRCPICEDVAAESKKPANLKDEAFIKDTKAKRRSMYLIVCRDSESEENKGVQVFEVAHFYLEKHISALAKKPFGGGFRLFSNPYNGQSVYFSKSGTGMGQEWSGFQFLDRDYAISEEHLDVAAATPLADFLILLGYEELWEKYYGKPFDGSSAKSPSDSSNPDYQPKTRAPKEDPPEEAKEATTRPTRAPKEEPAKEDPPSRTTRAPKEDPPSRATRAPKEEPPEEEQPVRRTRRPLQEEPAEKEQESSAKCPGGGVFGRDIDKLSGCGPCELWDDCAIEAQRLEQEGK